MFEREHILMALVKINSLQKYGIVSKFASCRLRSSLFCYTQFTTSPSNVAWKNDKFGNKKKLNIANSLSVERKSFDLQSQDSELSIELLPFNEPQKKVVFSPKHTRTIVLKVDTNFSLLQKWAQDPLLDHREVIALSLRDYKRCLKNLLESEMQCKNLHRTGVCQNHKKWQVSGIYKVPKDWTSSRFGHNVTLSDTQYVNSSYTKPDDVKWNVVQSNSKKKVEKLSYFEKENIKVTKSDKPSPTELADVLLMLREELPLFFVKSPRYDLYHKNMKFVNNMVGMTTRGLTAYRAWLSSVKTTNKLLMSDLSLDILKITKDSQDSTVKVRWRIRGIPRYQIILPIFSEKYSYIDGFSVFEVGTDGLIHCHRLERVMPSSSRQKQKPAWTLGIFGLFGFLSQQRTAEVFEILDTD